MIKNIEALKLDVEQAHSGYLNSDGKEWLKYILVLKMLYSAYCANNMLQNARDCRKELSSVMSRAQNKIPNPIPEGNNSVADSVAFEEILFWAGKEEECRKELEKGGSVNTYAKVINALCEYLCLAGERELALMKYEEVLGVLMEDDNNEKEAEDELYLIMVIMLKISECSREIRDENLSRYYSVYPLLYYAQKAGKGQAVSETINWEYIAELCKPLVA